jgi:hypothetical protein
MKVPVSPLLHFAVLLITVVLLNSAYTSAASAAGVFTTNGTVYGSATVPSVYNTGVVLSEDVVPTGPEEVNGGSYSYDDYGSAGFGQLQASTTGQSAGTIETGGVSYSSADFIDTITFGGLSSTVYNIDFTIDYDNVLNSVATGSGFALADLINNANNYIDILPSTGPGIYLNSSDFDTAGFGQIVENVAVTGGESLNLLAGIDDNATATSGSAQSVYGPVGTAGTAQATASTDLDFAITGDDFTSQSGDHYDHHIEHSTAPESSSCITLAVLLICGAAFTLLTSKKRRAIS